MTLTATLNDRQQARYAFRMQLLTKHEFAAADAKRWAERLAARDADLDDRRLCIECSNLSAHGWKCKRNGAVLKDVLQRCHSFVWNTPKKG